MNPSPVHYELDQGVAVLRLDDGKANAISPAVIDAMRLALDRAENEATALAILGRDKRLSAGFDLSVMTGGADAMRRLVLDGAELFLRLYAFPLPVVVGCTGHALAAGAILLLSADYRVGSAGDFKIGLNEVAIQMILPTFGVEMARARLSPRHLSQAITQARIYDPTGACEAGYLDEAVPQDMLVERTITSARRLGGLPRASFHGTKLKERRATIDLIRGSLEEDIAQLTMGLG